MTRRSGIGWVAAAAVTLCSGSAWAQETFKLGVVSFLSGQAAESFGIPAVNGAKVLVDAFNKGAAPASASATGCQDRLREVCLVIPCLLWVVPGSTFTAGGRAPPASLSGRGGRRKIDYPEPACVAA